MPEGMGWGGGSRGLNDWCISAMGYVGIKWVNMNKKIGQYKIWTADCGLRTGYKKRTGYNTPTEYKMQTEFKNCCTGP